MTLNLTAILVFAVLVNACATHGNAPIGGETAAWDVCYRSFEKHVDAIAGENSTDCGFWRLGQSKSLLRDVKECAKEAAGKDGAFKFGHSDMGYDSYFCDVAIQDSTGQLWSFFYDSDISGGSGGPATIWISECKSLAFEKGTIGTNSFFSLDGCELNDELKSKLLNNQ